MPPLGEFEIIERFFTRPTRDRDVLIGIGDDAAVLDVQGPLAVTVDTLTAGVHFPDDFAAEDLGHRALAVNLSDIAAMGGVPRWCTLALTLPNAQETWLADFSRGFFALAERHGVTLIGGNLSRGPLSVSVQLMGQREGQRFLRRDGGAAEDDVYVTGSLGDAAAGLALLRDGATADASETQSALIERYARPTPRIEAGRALAPLATAAIDISDGLAADLGHLIAASGCGAVIELDGIPLSEALCDEHGIDAALEHALGGSDDYELCFTAARDRRVEIEAALSRVGTAGTRIGRLVDGHDIEWRRDGRAVEIAGGYRHF